MRRWISTVTAGIALAVTLSACGNPSGVDGDLTDDWAAPPEPTVFVPAAGVCHPTFQTVGYLHAYHPVDCAQPHVAETLHLGTVTGPEAGRDAPPKSGSAGLRALRGDCEKKTNEYLGGHWRSGRLAMTVVLPSPYAWTGGARWYRCDVKEVKSLDVGDPVERSGSLRGALKGASDLAHRCFQPRRLPTTDQVSGMEAVPCGTKHRSEFAGIWTAPNTSYDAFEKDTARVHKGCRGVIAAYAKIPNDGDIKFRVGSIYYPPEENEWVEGHRSVQCFLWTSDRDLTRSLKGAGTKGLPIRVG